MATIETIYNCYSTPTEALAALAKDYPGDYWLAGDSIILDGFADTPWRLTEGQRLTDEGTYSRSYSIERVV